MNYFEIAVKFINIFRFIRKVFINMQKVDERYVCLIVFKVSFRNYNMLLGN